MKAMILAAGRGERMRPLTDHTPKPLLMAGGQPLIVHHLLRLAACGIRDVVINHAWLGERITAHLGDGSAWGVHIRYSAEESALETAGGIATALPLLGPEPFLLINGDIHTDWDLAAAPAIARTLEHEQLLVWCVLTANPAHHPQGDFALTGQRLSLAQGLARHTYSGISICHPELVAGIPSGARHPLGPCLRTAIGAGRAGGEYHQGEWTDVGTPERLALLDQTLSARPDRNPHPLTP